MDIIRMTTTCSEEKLNEYMKKEFLAAHNVMREAAKNEGRKEVWDMVRRLYLSDGVENTYDFDDLKKVFGTAILSEILMKDVHEVLDKDKERLKKIEEEKIIRPGDEVIVNSPWLPGVHKGWAVDIYKNLVNVLMNTRNGVEMRYVGVDRCRKTGNTSEHLAKLVEAMKEENANE